MYLLSLSSQRKKTKLSVFSRLASMGITPLCRQRLQRLQSPILNIRGTMVLIMVKAKRMIITVITGKAMSMVVAVNTINPEILISFPWFEKGVKRKPKKRAFFGSLTAMWWSYWYWYTAKGRLWWLDSCSCKIAGVWNCPQFDVKDYMRLVRTC